MLELKVFFESGPLGAGIWWLLGAAILIFIVAMTGKKEREGLFRETAYIRWRVVALVFAPFVIIFGCYFVGRLIA